MADYLSPGTFTYTRAGSNTLVQVTGTPTILYHVSVSHQGGSVGFLQLYNSGTAAAGAGTPDFVIAVDSGTTIAANPSFQAARDVVFGPAGRSLQGLSYLWAAGGTGTVAHGVNAVVDITYKA